MTETNSKLSINLKEGTIQVEGDEAFVRFIYQDFKDSLSKYVIRDQNLQESNSEKDVQITPLLSDSSQSPSERKKRNSRKSQAVKSSDKPNVSDYKPSFRGDLNLKDLEFEYNVFAPKNHSEKILLFATFLRDKVGISPCTADDIYTCYRTLKGKTDTPQAFVQAFRTAESRTHYIEFVSQQEIKITIAGDNYFEKHLNKKRGNSK